MSNGQSHVNQQEHPKPQELASHIAALKVTTPLKVWVSQNSASAPITQVKQSTLSANNLYWLNVSPGHTVHSLDFVVTFKSGSPLTTQWQHFSFPGGYGGTTTTPFGVPFWGGNPILGPATLTVLADGGLAGTYNFTVVP